MSYFRPVLECKSIVLQDIKKIKSNIWNRMVVGIVTCEQNKTRFANFMQIYENIFKNLGLDYYVILANPSIDHKYTINLDKHDRKIFTARAKEAYENLAHKINVFYSYVYNETDFDYVIKVDDGCLLDLSKIALNMDADYMGSIIKPTLNTVHFNKCTDKKYNSTRLDFLHDLNLFSPLSKEIQDKLYNIRFAGGGYGYRLSRNALQHMEKYESHIMSLGLSYEDVLLGQILYLEGIELVGCGIGRYHMISN